MKSIEIRYGYIDVLSEMFNLDFYTYILMQENVCKGLTNIDSIYETIISEIKNG